MRVTARHYKGSGDGAGRSDGSEQDVSYKGKKWRTGRETTGLANQMGLGRDYRSKCFTGEKRWRTGRETTGLAYQRATRGQNVNQGKKDGGLDGTRTRDPRRDRPVF